MTDPQDGPVIVYRSARERDCNEHALVLRAMDIAHEQQFQEGAFVLLVAAPDAGRAREQLRRFEAENPAAPQASDEAPPRLASGVDGAIGWALLLIAVELLARRDAFDHDWLAAGVADARLLRAGEWWRAVTALTLHADLAHLAGNLLFGAVFLAALCQFTGTGAAVLLCLLSGALGNALEALVQTGGHRSLGASTAVFGTLGALAALQWRHRLLLRQRRVRRWTPLVIAAFLLGYLGTEGVRTDILAHVAGMTAGLLAGALPVERVQVHLARGGLQCSLAAAGVSLVVVAWWLALAAK